MLPTSPNIMADWLNLTSSFTLSRSCTYNFFSLFNNWRHSKEWSSFILKQKNLKWKIPYNNYLRINSIKLWLKILYSASYRKNLSAPINSNAVFPNFVWSSLILFNIPMGMDSHTVFTNTNTNMVKIYFYRIYQSNQILKIMNSYL